MTGYLPAEECARRWPRLLRACCWVACLGTGEASCNLRDYRRFRDAIDGPEADRTFCGLSGWRTVAGDAREYLAHGGGEAVAHFGGPLRVIERAIAVRHAVLRMYGPIESEVTA